MYIDQSKIQPKIRKKELSGWEGRFPAVQLPSLIFLKRRYYCHQELRAQPLPYQSSQAARCAGCRRHSIEYPECPSIKEEDRDLGGRCKSNFTRAQFSTFFPMLSTEPRAQQVLSKHAGWKTPTWFYTRNPCLRNDRLPLRTFCDPSTGEIR